jgi:hypothetical protein
MNQDTPFQTKIAESAEVLSDLLSQQDEHWSYLKVKTLYLLKVGKANTFQQVAELLELHIDTPRRWFRTYEKFGLQALISNHPLLLSCVPDWSTERLLQELQKVTFLPAPGITQAWLLTIGIRVSNDTASLLISILKPRLQTVHSRLEGQALENSNLLPEPILLSLDVYPLYEQWKQEHQVSSDIEACSQIIGEFFKSNQAESAEGLVSLDEPSAISPQLGLATPAERPEVPAFLNQTDLAKRLGVNNSLLSRNRSKLGFPRWSKQYDPDGIAWQWLPSSREYQSSP